MKRPEQCPLCSHNKTHHFFHSCISNLVRDYFICCLCNLIFVPTQFHLSPKEQKDRYLQHNNDPNDPEYRKFLSKLSDELAPHLTHNSKGLDYGSGPGPTLAIMLEKDGFDMKTYDIFFQPDRSVLSQSYAFVTCTETAEHFSAPRKDFETLDSLVEPGGWIGLMTTLLDDSTEFPNWYYKRDPTHITFYSKATMRWIANLFDWKVFFPRKTIVLFQKPLY